MVASDRRCGHRTRLLLAAGGLLLGLLLAAPVTASSVPGQSAALVGATFLAQGESLDQQIGGATRGLFRELRRAWRTVLWMFGRAFEWWGGWIKRGAFYFGVALVAAMADSGLVNAWRVEGLRALVTYVPLMLYVYGRLLFSAGVALLPKLLLLGALVYGVVRRDLLPDRSFVPGRLEDIVLIVIATRAFVYACPEALVDEYAERAVSLRRRIAALQQRPR